MDMNDKRYKSNQLLGIMSDVITLKFPVNLPFSKISSFHYAAIVGVHKLENTHLKALNWKAKFTTLETPTVIKVNV